MALTGRADGPPLVAPESVPIGLRAVEGAIHRLSSRLGATVDLDALALLGERAALLKLTRAGDRSCGGATRLMRTAGDWIAVSLARPDDLSLVPAWLQLTDPVADDVWQVVRRLVADRHAEDLVTRGRMLGLPLARIGETNPPQTSRIADVELPVLLQPVGDAPAVGSLSDVVVVDLSSLWAGPLCVSILALAGARVIKVESTSRPDGSRTGPPAFFDLMHGGKESMALDFATEPGVATLRELLLAADVVIEASRPRALEQMRIGAVDVVRTGRTKVWASITGYGRGAPNRDWVAFGDDAAVAGGLVVWDETGPCFCADAVADPATGLVAAAACLGLLAETGTWLLDVPMAGVAAHLAGPTRDHGPSPAADADGYVATARGRVQVAPPRSRRVVAGGPALGADTERVVAELRTGRLAGRTR